jgi:hypothetical protein
MPVPRPTRTAALGLLAALALPAAAQPASFDFTIAGFKVGQVVMDSRNEGDRYAAAARVDTAGVVSVLADFYFDGQAQGTVGRDGRVVPHLFTAKSRSPRAERTTRVEWQGGTPVSVSVVPPRDGAPEPSTQGGTVDPVSASFRLLSDAPADQVCNTTIDIFDGSRRSRLRIGAAQAAGEMLVCQGAYARIEGESHSLADLREFPFTLSFSRDGEMARLQRIEAPTNFGKAVLSRRD